MSDISFRPVTPIRRAAWIIKVFFTVVLFFGATTVLADGLIVLHDPPNRPPHTPSVTPLEVKYHNVNVTITDQLALTQVDQVFHNPNNLRLEGTYLFPIPKGAQIDKLQMDVGGVMMDAELLDAAKARRIYEDIVRRQRDPALLEYAGQGLFKLRVFPIEPFGDKRIKLSYTQLLPKDGALVRYLYPLNTEKFSSRPLGSVAIKVEINCSGHIKTLYSPSHEVDIKRHSSKNATLGFEAKEVKPDTDFEILYSLASSSEIGIDILTYNDGEADGGFFLLLASPPMDVKQADVVKKDVGFVLDTSGSMAERGKLDQAKRALSFCLANLESEDRFEVVRFSTEAEALFGALAEANASNRAKAEEFVRAQKPIGGTAIDDALKLALTGAKDQWRKERPLFVVFLTDGKPTVGPTNNDEIITHVQDLTKDRAARVFCFGIGNDVNTHLLDRITEQTKAVSQYVLPNEDIETKVSSFYGKLAQPVLANLKLQTSPGVRLTKIHPTNLPDLFKGDQLVVFGRYSGNGDTAVTLNGTVNGKSRSFTTETNFARKTREHEFIPRLWATRRVGYLLDQIRLHGENAELRDEVTELARRYGIVTPYTAYLIVEDESRRDIESRTRTLQQIDGDIGLRKEAGRAYNDARKVQSGADAVESSKVMQGLQESKSLNMAQSSGVEGGISAAPPLAAPAARMSQALKQQQTRHIAGRTFYQNGSQWIDSNVQKHQKSPTQKIRFGSTEYFTLLNTHPEATKWLALGKNLLVVLGESVVEIYE